MTLYKEWLRNGAEILVLFRYSRAGGKKSFEFFSSFDALSGRLRELRPQTQVVAFRQAQLPIRGEIDDALIETCLRRIPDGSEFLVVETVRRTAGRMSWFHNEAGESHEELRESLESSRGTPVAVGAYPRFWLEDPDVITAIAPDEHGKVSLGVYSSPKKWDGGARDVYHCHTAPIQLSS